MKIKNKARSLVSRYEPSKKTQQSSVRTISSDRTLRDLDTNGLSLRRFSGPRGAGLELERFRHIDSEVTQSPSQHGTPSAALTPPGVRRRAAPGPTLLSPPMPASMFAFGASSINTAWVESVAQAAQNINLPVAPKLRVGSKGRHLKPEVVALALLRFAASRQGAGKRALPVDAADFIENILERNVLTKVQHSTATEVANTLLGFARELSTGHSQLLHGAVEQLDMAAFPGIVPATKHNKYDVVTDPDSNMLLPNASRFMQVQCIDGQTFYMTNTLEMGGFGKFRLAVDAEGNAHAVKEFRSERARHQESESPKTSTTPAGELQDELRILWELGEGLRPVTALRVDGKVYVVMPLYDGNLSEIRAGDRNTPERVAMGREVLGRLALQLSELHSKGIVHFDIKLNNVLWDGEGRIVLSDFGLAGRLRDTERWFNRRGTIRYAAPEVARRVDHNAPADVRLNERASYAADTWSLALLFAEMHLREPHSRSSDERNVPNPFNCEPLRNPTSELNDWDQEANRHAEYAAWRKKHLVGDSVDLSILQTLPADQRTAWDNYFVALYQADPTVAQFVVNRMLVPDPKLRAQSQDITAFLETLAGPSTEAASKVQNVWSYAAELQTQRRNTLEALDFFRSNYVSISKQDSGV